ncbi:MAG: S-formylglutathione hydrolase FrmB [Phycisphaerales bacterium]|jgi:S-formylglutathione hydrolase FrmB
MRSLNLSLLILAASTLNLVAQDLSFQVTIDESVRAEPYSGRVYVALADEGSRSDPRQAMHAWVNPPPLFSLDVSDLKPGQPVTLSDSVLANPSPMSQLAPGTYKVQAIARINPDSPKPGLGAGDLISSVQTITLDPELGWSIDLVLDGTVEPRVFEETDRVRLFEMVSPRLSEFAGRDVTIKAGVILPPGFDQRTDETFPVIYLVTGFGGDHFFAHGMVRSGMTTSPNGLEAIWVVPDASCYRGHSVFANSDNNGPWGDALMHDMIPALEAQFRGAGAEHRYTTGVSSGGWSSLWLQLAYPDAFAGCWSHVPDPVELHAFQTVDVYNGDNMLSYPDGSDRPIARNNGEVMITARDFVARETVMGPGGQIHSFEAVWSPRLPTGEPRPLFDRETGAVDPVTAEAWKKYDIAHMVRTQWDTIGPKLGGKVHVYAGSEDNFYLELAVPALQEAFKEVGSDAVVEIIEGMGHSLHRDGQTDMLNTIAERWSIAKAEGTVKSEADGDD